MINLSWSITSPYHLIVVIFWTWFIFFIFLDSIFLSHMHLLNLQSIRGGDSECLWKVIHSYWVNISINSKRGEAERQDEVIQRKNKDKIKEWEGVFQGSGESDSTSFLKLIDSSSDFLLFSVFRQHITQETGQARKRKINGGERSMAF